jgi:hypothetical protein
MSEAVGPPGGERQGSTNRNLPPMTIPQHGLTRYLRVRLEVDDGVLRWEQPRTVLGVVPVGHRRVAVPLEQVTSLRLQRPGRRPIRLAAGLLMMGLPAFFLPWWAAVPVIILGGWVTLVALGPALRADTVAGKHYHTGVCFGHQFDADLFIEAANDMAGNGAGSDPIRAHRADREKEN